MGTPRGSCHRDDNGGQYHSYSPRDPPEVCAAARKDRPGWKAAVSSQPPWSPKKEEEGEKGRREESTSWPQKAGLESADVTLCGSYCVPMPPTPVKIVVWDN